ncbi:Yae1-N domain-containing protein [Mycena venus]|uniref:Protein YAE1 n=1 Tax=Mycena venus TaxID=2733690 RepID=A0A8H6XR69_9AGAR|nr:Yae1-N domain-containing protein [Mycena venus]
MMHMDSPWDEEATQETSRDIEWSKISSEFTNVGYREGITAGKESALQEGFDTGFAGVGAPLGRDIGFLRGMSSALVAFLNSNMSCRAISRREEHAREHLADADDPMDENEELSDKRKMEGLEDMLSRLTAGAANPEVADKTRPTIDDKLRAIRDEYCHILALGTMMRGFHPPKDWQTLACLSDHSSWALSRRIRSKIHSRT